MFICPKCSGNKSYFDESYGRCEFCGKSALCGNYHRGELPGENERKESPDDLVPVPGIGYLKRKEIKGGK